MLFPPSSPAYLAMEGLPLVLLHLLDLLLVAALLLVAGGLGRVLLGRAGYPDAPALEEGVLSVLLGSGLLAAVILGLAAVGLARPPALAVLLLVGAGVGRRATRGWIRTAAGWTGAEAARTWRSDPVLVISLGLVALALLLAAGAPPWDYDTQMYHLPVPAQVLETGRLEVPAGNLHVAFVGLPHMLYLPLLAWGSPAAPALLSAAFALMLAGAVAGWGGRLFSPATGTVGTMAFLGTGSILLVAATPRVDVTLAGFLFAAHLALLGRPDGGCRAGRAGVSGALFGLALGVKYHALVYLAAAAPLLLVALLRERRDGGRPWRVLAAFAGAFAVTSAPWLLKNWALLGSPLYPFFAERVLPPWLAEAAGGRAIPPRVDPAVFGVIGRAKEPIDLLGLFLSPGRMTTEAEGVRYHLSPLLLGLLPAIVLVRRIPNLARLLLPPAGYLLATVASQETTNLRYLIPALPALGLGAAAGALFLWERLAGRRGRSAPGLAILGLVALLPAARVAWERVSSPLAWSHLAGVVSPRTYLASVPDQGARGAFLAAQEARRWLPSRPRTLLLLEARGLYFPREVLPDNVLTNWPLALAVGATGDCLARTEVTHVLVNRGAQLYYQGRGMDLAVLGWDHFPGFRDRCLEPEFSLGGFELYRTREPGPVSPSPPPAGSPALPQSSSIPSP